MNTTTKLKKPLIIVGIALLIGASGVGGWYVLQSKNKDQSNTVSTNSTSSAKTDDSGDIDWSSLPTTNVSLTNDGLAITTAGTYVLSGTTTGQVSVNTDGYVRIVLSGATINSSKDSAIYVAAAKKTVIELADGTTNTVSDASNRRDQEIDGAIYSADDLVINGNGSLTVKANFADGIVSKDDLWINSGNITITSADDGIRGKDSLNISGGTITINATGDGMKATNSTDLGKGQLVISGGTITITSGDDAIKAEQKISITGGVIKIPNSVEGIEAPVIVIDDGEIDLYASDDGINASASDIITDGLSITINGGTIKIEVGPGDTDAIDSNGDITVNGGTIDITAQVSSFDYDGTGVINGGNVTVNGQKITTMPQQMMGGPRR